MQIHTEFRGNFAVKMLRNSAEFQSKIPYSAGSKKSTSVDTLCEGSLPAAGGVSRGGDGPAGWQHGWAGEGERWQELEEVQLGAENAMPPAVPAVATSLLNYIRLR